MDTRNATRRQWRRSIRRRRRRRAGTAKAILIAAVTLAVFGILLIPENHAENLQAVEDNGYQMTMEDYEEFNRQREEYLAQEAEEAAREAEEIRRGMEELEAAQQKEAETQLKFSRAYYSYPEPFNAPPIIWYEDQLEGFQEYKIPDEYERSGGYFPDIVQEYLWVVCQEKDLDFVTMVALYESESAYQFDVIGDAGDSGYGQIVPSCNADLLEQLGIEDILNPYQNILASCTLMEWLLSEYEGNYAKALTAYNAGTGGAYKYYFSAGVDASPYTKRILNKAERIRKEMQDAAEN